MKGSSAAAIRTFWQNLAQIQIYGSQANTLIDNAGVIQAFGPRNLRMAQDLAAFMGGVSPEEIMKMRADEQMILMESEMIRCKQTRYHNDGLFMRN